VDVCKERRLSNCFTLEASYCNGTWGSFIKNHYTVQQHLDLGVALCRAIGDLVEPDQQAVKQVGKEFANREQSK